MFNFHPARGFCKGQGRCPSAFGLTPEYLDQEKAPGFFLGANTPAGGSRAPKGAAVGSVERLEVQAGTFLDAREPARGDGLRLGVEAQRVGTVLVQVAEGRLLPAAEGVVAQRHRDREVDPDHADVDAAGEIARGVAIGGEDRGAVAVIVVDHQLQRVVIAVHPHRRQHRPEDLLAVDVHLGGDVVEERRADVEAVLVALDLQAAAIDDERRALLDARADQPVDPVLRLLGDDRPEVDVVARGIGADLELLDLRNELLDQPVGGFLAHRHRDRDRHAAFARRAEARTHQRIGRLVEIGVGHDDHVVLRAAEALCALAVGAGTAIDVLCDRGGPHEAHGLHGLVVEDRVDDFLVAVHHLQHAIGQARFLGQLGKPDRGRGAALRGFQDHRVAGNERRAHLPQRDHRREVEGRDARDDAKRLTHRVEVDARAGAVGVFALEKGRRAHADLDHLEPALHVAARIGQGLAMLARDELGQLVHMRVDQVAEFHHHPGAALRVGRGPDRLRGGGGGNRRVEFRGGGERDARLHLARRRVVDVSETAGRARHQLAVDPVSDLLHRVPPVNWSRKP
ncbi:hypothetical protein SDC9_18917 [bioreactor metagenome]|uniref:Uncharacterized protein n=1 Tax=bioreactor metagenome TaxID=1076179 RepID=A0A644U1K6_9ZZZZ